MKKKNAIAWLEKPQAKDYPAAATYLSLFYEEARAASCVRKLRGAKTREYRAVDLFRASGLKMDNAHLKEDRKKIRAGKKLSPLLLVRNPGIGRITGSARCMNWTRTPLLPAGW